MIDKEYGKFVPTCDGCDKTLPPQDSFEDAKDAMIEAGWTRRWSADGATNYCPLCREG